jgi:hypothetical protein
MSEKRDAKRFAVAQAEIAEPVQAVALVLTPSHYIAGQFGLVGDVVQQTKRKAEAAGFAHNNLFALTDQALYVIDIVNPNRMKVRTISGVWRWDEFTATGFKKGLHHYLNMEWVDGRSATFEFMSRGMFRSQLPVLDEIVRRSAAPRPSNP